MNITKIDRTTHIGVSIEGLVLNTLHGQAYEVTYAKVEISLESDYLDVTFWGYRQNQSGQRAANAAFGIVTAVNRAERIAAETDVVAAATAHVIEGGYIV